ncbi:MAG: hypothetical protein IPJ41_15355 [Phycisphaerales bacterium]|nr:hypothetical protein [Phycisphaerales bacterium]
MSSGPTGSQTPETKPKSGIKGFALFLGALVVLVVGGIGLGSLLFGPPPKKQYDRSTPEEVLAAAKDMVLNSDAERLSELFYAENDQMRELYARLGLVLGHVQDLGVAINARFPDDVAKARATAEAAAKSGKGLSLLQQFNPAQRGARNGPPSAADSERWNQLLQTIASDPYAWLTDAQGRLSFTYIDDERVAVLWDGKPVLPPLGLIMRQEQGQWAVVLPLAGLPMASRFMPQTPDEYSIWGSLIQMADNVIVDLEKDVREGRLTSLDNLARTAGEKAAPPMLMGMIAYNKALEERRRREREAKAAPKPTGDG